MRTLLLPTLAVAALGASLAAAVPEPDLVKATELPVLAHQLRADGVADKDLGQAMQAAKKHGLPAAETSAILQAEAEGGKANGRIDNFGSFVQSQLAEGKRGRELAEAIHAEHAARGKGKGKGKGNAKGHDKDHGESKGKGKGPSKPDDAGKERGKSGDHAHGKGGKHGGEKGHGGEKSKGKGNGGQKGKGKGR